MASRLSTYGEGGGPVLLSAVGCSGTEARLADCSSGSVAYYCSNGRSAGVKCLDSKFISLITH